MHSSRSCELEEQIIISTCREVRYLRSAGKGISAEVFVHTATGESWDRFEQGRDCHVKLKRIVEHYVTGNDRGCLFVGDSWIFPAVAFVFRSEEDD